ncbi:ATPase provides energy for both assembly of type IV secretion complex and secretion of T-DNA complex (VirB4) [Castellaniella defragrans 65Phen]|uniref:Type IV secretion system protein virB4 n=1 Tax=Castellaniella defragrans (strain DSM 12143 / CCUG 39792 / 65Phen) TaxID=1437824 RepID=W8WZK4_CASD6|nr:VirB4 family type IV secretion/conjugal transfer ATPase [Castellaniella defragrans]CDM25183.1 ATPase provides energy for both assembly of type IV secretion complex and secretion of T-DNA complex (VirB4) [Castellaniella defragrans 65Phen]
MTAATALAVDERLVSRYLPYSHHVTDRIIACDNHEYLAVIKVAGRAPDAYGQAELKDWIEALHNVLRGLPMGSLGLYSHIIRRRVTEYPDSTFAQAFATRFDAAYRATFDTSGLMVNDLYLSVLIHPVADPVLGTFASLEKADAKRLAHWQDESIERLDSAVRALTAGLYRYDPQILGIVDRRGLAFSETAELMGFLLSGTHRPVPISRERLRETLPQARPIFGRHGELGELRTVAGSRLFGMMELRDYPEATKPGHLDRLLGLPHEFVLTQSWGSHTGAAAKKLVKKHHKLLVDSGDDSVSQVTQLTDVMDDLTSARLGLGDHHATLLVYGTSADSVRQALAQTATALAEDAVGFRPLDRALEAGFWAQLPGNWHWRPRPVPVTSLNFLCFSSLHNQLTGKPAGNPWGPAVTMLKTQTGSPFFFNFHASTEDLDETGKRRPGNTLIIGMTGTGKTVLQGMLLTQAQKFGAACVVWDKDQGMQVLIMALGGRYFNIRLGEPTGWNPFQMEATKGNVAFMVRLVTYLAERQGEAVTTRQRADITQAVQQLTTLIDRPARTLSTLNTLLPNPYSEDDTRSTIHARLAPWCQGGEYGWVFDNPTDDLDLQTSSDRPALFGFDLTELLDDDEVRGAATLYLKHRVDALHDGRRIINLYDECQHPLKDAHFQESMQDAARTIRKKNGVLALATQEPGAIIDNPVGASLVQQTATLILLPNPKARARDYIEGFGLTVAEFELLQSLGEASRKFLVKQGASVTVAQLDLSGCDDELLVFSGSPDMAEIAEAAVAQAGTDPAAWLPVYLAAVKQARQ